MQKLRQRAGKLTASKLETLDPQIAQFKRFRILLATDGSEHSNAAAKFLAKVLTPGQADVRLITIVSHEFYPYDLIYGDELSDAADRRAAIASQEKAAFGDTAKVLRASGQAVFTCHRFGSPVDEIAEEIAEWDPDLVVVGRRGLGRPAAWILGSVSEYLVRHSKVPVLVVP